MSSYVPSPTTLQLELSTMCNVLCLGCVRTDVRYFNRKKPSVPDKMYHDIDVLTKTIKSFKTVVQVELIGTIDEPMMYPHIFELCEFLIDNNITVTMHTNGSLRSEKDWVKLGNILKKGRHQVSFSIDGKKEEHEYYRQKSNYEKILKNAAAYLSTGAQGNWQLVEFPWNKHQIPELEKLSKEMGFHEFRTRPDRSGISDMTDEYIEQRKQTEYREPTYDDFSYPEDLPKRKISCSFGNKNMYFISYDFRLWPCCFISNTFFKYGEETDLLKERIYGNYGEDFNDLNKKTVEEILDSPFFKEDLLDSFTSTTFGSGCKDKISRCAQTCGMKNDLL